MYEKNEIAVFGIIREKILAAHIRCEDVSKYFHILEHLKSKEVCVLKKAGIVRIAGMIRKIWRKKMNRFYNTQRQKLAEEIIDCMVEEDFLIKHLEAIWRIVTALNWSAETEKEIIDFSLVVFDPLRQMEKEDAS